VSLLNLQSQYRAGELLSKRFGIYGGFLNRRRRASRKELTDWIRCYQKQVSSGTYCPIRGGKIITHFQGLLDRLEEPSDRRGGAQSSGGSTSGSTW
jgi:hypothetical protein